VPDLGYLFRGKYLLENTGIGISEPLELKNFWGACPQTPLEAQALTAAYCFQTTCYLKT